MIPFPFRAFPLIVTLALTGVVIPGRAGNYEVPAPEISLDGVTATVSWQGNGVLISSADLAAGWTDTGAADSPFEITTSDFPGQFFKVAYQTSSYVTVDTNQTTFYDTTGAAIDPAPVAGEAYFGQDAAYRETPPNTTDNLNGTVSDNNTGLIWQQVPPEAFYSWTEAQAYADSLDLAGEDDWRLPTIKELLSLADFNGSSRAEIDLPYIDDSVFTVYDPQEVGTFVPAGTSSTKRDIDGQYWSSTAYVGRTINDDSVTFGFNFVDGRIKGYPNGVLSGPTGTAFVRCVRGNPDYGKNNFIDNGDGTITDLATGLMWLQDDSGAYPSAGSRGNGTLDWVEALDWAENLTHAGYDDWTLPDAKQLHTIVDYSRAPDAEDPAMQSAAIDPVFHITEQESWFWSSTSLGDDLFEWAVYVCFGRALAIDQTTFLPTTNAHGAGAMRSDPKVDDGTDYSEGHGPQYDQIRTYNYVRPVRRAFTPPAPVSVAAGDVSTILSGSVPADLAVLPGSVTFGGAAVDPGTVYRPSQQVIAFDYDTTGLAPGDYAVEVTFGAPYGTVTGSYTIHASTLLLIVDDWGHDASPLDNAEPGVHLANMPNLAALAAEGLRFTRAYAQPSCSPTRATMMTGRQPWQTEVGNASEFGNFSTDEITLPEIFTTMNAPHALLSVGKWHLGGGDGGYATRGGWPEFYGINGAEVADYSSWEKNSNGSVATTTTYSTTDQVNEAKTFIEANVANGTPWFAWVGFNAPHTPFHDPPAELAPSGGYSTKETGESNNFYQFRRMLEALDTEIGRLLESIDPAQTNIILIGDNGNGGQVVQAPYSPGHAKETLYNGGIHVPMVVKGPAVTVSPGSTTDTVVHCIDLFSTVLELSGIDESGVPGLAGQGVGSTSIVPILTGTDTAARCAVAEVGGDAPGRAIILGAYPDYKLIISGDPDSSLDDPTFEFYNIGSPAFDVDEQTPLDTGSLTGNALAAYNACIAKDAALGGGYSDPSIGGYDTIYIELPSSGVTPPVPTLLSQVDGTTPIEVTSVTVDGVAATVIGRLDSGTALADESDDQDARYWVKAWITPSQGAGAYTTAHVVFPDSPQGATREYDSTNTILVNPNP
ncbi:MAG: DUF1566 domain-containing protein [Verrucomicrobiales bacterium]